MRVTAIDFSGAPNLKHIGKYLFFECNQVTSLVIPDTVETLGKYAFGKFERMTSLTIGSSVADIDEFTFSDINSLPSVVIPSSVTNIGLCAFEFGDEMTNVVCLAEVPPALGRLAFQNSPKLAAIQVPPQSVQDYKRVWSEYADLIVEIPIPVARYGKFENHVSYTGTLSQAVQYALDNPNLIADIQLLTNAAAVAGMAFTNCSAALDLDGYTLSLNGQGNIVIDSSDVSLERRLRIKAGDGGAITGGVVQVNAGGEAELYGGVLSASFALSEGKHLWLAQALGEGSEIHVAPAVLPGPDDFVVLASGMGTYTVTAADASKIKCSDDNYEVVFDSSTRKVILRRGIGFEFTYDGLKYKVTSEDPMTAAVATNAPFAGALNIPATATDGFGRTFSVTEVGAGAFRASSNLTEVAIHENIAAIGAGAFADCPRLATVVCLPTVPPTVDASFDSIAPGAIIYVRPESVAAYRAAAGWGEYAASVQPIPVRWGVTAEAMDSWGPFPAAMAFVATNPVTHLQLTTNVTAFADLNFTTNSATLDLDGFSLDLNGEWDIAVTGSVVSSNSILRIKAGDGGAITGGVVQVNVGGEAMLDGGRLSAGFALSEGKWLSIAQALGEGSEIWVAPAVLPGPTDSVVLASGTNGYAVTAADAAKIKCSDANYEVAYDSANQRIVLRQSVGYEFTCGGLKYKVTSEDPMTAAVASNTPFAGALNIPATATDGFGRTFSVTEVGAGAFRASSNLTEVTIQENITALGNGAFADCPRLATVVCLPTVPPKVDASFDSIAPGAIIYVRPESVAAYRAAAGWGEYAAMIQPIPVRWGVTAEAMDSWGPFPAAMAFVATNEVSHLQLTTNVTAFADLSFTTNTATLDLAGWTLNLADSKLAIAGTNAALAVRGGSIVGNLDLSGGAVLTLAGALGASSALTVTTTPAPVAGSPVAVAIGSASYTLTEVDTAKFRCASSGAAFFLDSEANTIRLRHVAVVDETFTVGGLNYRITSIDPKRVELVNGSYSGDIVIPDSVNYDGDSYAVTAIAGGAFEGCSSLRSVQIPASVTSIDSTAFAKIGGNVFSSISVASSNPNYSSDGGVLYNKSKTEIIRWPTALNSSITIASSVTVIADYAFYGCNNEGFNSVILPKSIESIGEYSFSKCGTLDVALTSYSAPSTCSTSFAETDCTICYPHGTPDASETEIMEAFKPVSKFVPLFGITAGGVIVTKANINFLAGAAIAAGSMLVVEVITDIIRKNKKKDDDGKVENDIVIDLAGHYVGWGVFEASGQTRTINVYIRNSIETKAGDMFTGRFDPLALKLGNALGYIEGGYIMVSPETVEGSWGISGGQIAGEYKDFKTKIIPVAGCSVNEPYLIGADGEGEEAPQVKFWTVDSEPPPWPSNWTHDASASVTNKFVDWFKNVAEIGYSSITSNHEFRFQMNVPARGERVEPPKITSITPGEASVTLTTTHGPGDVNGALYIDKSKDLKDLIKTNNISHVLVRDWHVAPAGIREGIADSRRQQAETNAFYRLILSSKWPEDGWEQPIAEPENAE